MDATELHTDGNAVAGLLQEVFAAEVTTARRVCDGCGEEHAIGEHRCYEGAGIVLRCPACGRVAAQVGVLPGEYVIGLRGAWRFASGS
ncbi:MAG TPA: DUF6510 family protein [Thermoleophilaceae bacterium]|jgi:hypothetical protein|nr:DUF6510 family protein [Thermoleophilaceae bacterium]